MALFPCPAAEFCAFISSEVFCILNPYLLCLPTLFIMFANLLFLWDWPTFLTNSFRTLMFSPHQKEDHQKFSNIELCYPLYFDFELPTCLFFICTRIRGRSLLNRASCFGRTVSELLSIYVQEGKVRRKICHVLEENGSEACGSPIPTYLNGNWASNPFKGLSKSHL